MQYLIAELCVLPLFELPRNGKLLCLAGEAVVHVGNGHAGLHLSK